LADRVARCSPKVYDGQFDPGELEEWIRGIEKNFTMIKIPEEKK